jgi:hypothetical protein
MDWTVLDIPPRYEEIDPVNVLSAPGTSYLQHAATQRPLPEVAALFCTGRNEMDRSEGGFSKYERLD